MSNQSVKAGHCQCTKADVLAPPLLILVQQIDLCLPTHIYAKINDFFFLLQSLGKAQEAETKDTTNVS